MPELASCLSGLRALGFLYHVCNHFLSSDTGLTPPASSVMPSFHRAEPETVAIPASCLKGLH